MTERKITKKRGITEEVRALYNIATAIDRLTLVLGHSILLSASVDTLTKRWVENRERFTGGFVDSSLISAMVDAENMIADRDANCLAPSEHIFFDTLHG